MCLKSISTNLRQRLKSLPRMGGSKQETLQRYYLNHIVIILYHPCLISFQVENGVFKILGRTSVDIIKSGGYKISALDVERVLLSHPNIVDVAVVGVNDQTWGQVVAAVAVLSEKDVSLDLDSLKVWCKDRMAKYWIPTPLVVLDEMPRNTMGKVNKKDLVKNVF